MSSSALESPISASLIVHSPIAVNNDTQLANLISINGWGGNGTDGNPFRLEHLTIDASGKGSAVYLGNITAHFLILGCVLEQASVNSPNRFASGITLFNATNGVIERTSCLDSQEGIVLVRCSSIFVANSTFTTISDRGVDLQSSTGNVVRNNTCHYANYALYLEASSYNWLDGNNFTQNQHGIRMSSLCEFNNITGNDFSSSWKTIEIYGSPNNVYADNNCSHSTYGIQLYSCDFSVVARNIMLESSWGGVYLSGSYGSKLWSNVMTGCSVLVDGTEYNVVSYEIPENNTVNGKPVYYLASEAGGSIIPNDVGQVILAGVSDAILQGATISHTTYAVQITHSDSISIVDCTLTDNSEGVSADNTVNLSVVDSVISRNGEGIYLYIDTNAHLQGNLLQNNTQAGMYISWTDSTLYSNNMKGCSISLSGGRATLTDQVIPENNTVNGLPVRYLVNLDMGGGPLSGPSGQIILGNISHAEIRDQAIDNVSNPLVIGYCSNLTIADSSFRFSNTAIYMEGTTGSVVRNVSCSDGDYGVWLQASDDNNLSDNAFLNNYYGVYLTGSNGNELDSDHFSLNDYGAYLTGSDDNRVHDCLFEMGSRFAVSLAGCHGNRIWSNTFIDNNGAYGDYSAYHIQAYDDRNNSWNMTQFGNAWSDWPGPDANHDGIVDEPYQIDGALAQDYLPRVPPDTTPPIVTIYSPHEGAQLSQLIFVASWSAVDTGSGLNRTEVRLDGRSWLNVGLATSISMNASTEGPHTFYVRAYDNSSNSVVEAANFTVVLPGEPPSAPVGLSAQSGDGFVSLSWSPPVAQGQSPLQYYQVYRGEGTDTPIVFRSVTVTSFNDTNVTNGLTYHYTVRAVSAAGQGVHSNEAVGTPTGVPPSAVQDLSALGGNGSVFLSWSAPAVPGGHPVIGYHVYRLNGVGSMSLLAGIASTSFQDTNVTNDVAYTYMVRAYSLSGEGAQSTASATPTYSTVPAKIGAVQATVQGPKILLTWSAPSNGGMPILSYNVYGSVAGGTPVLLASPSGTQCNITSFQNGTTYAYLVTAVNVNGEGPRSDAVSVTPNPPVQAAPPDTMLIAIIIVVVAGAVVAAALVVKRRGSGKKK